MVEVKNRLLGHIRTAAEEQRSFDATRSQKHLKATFYTWTAHNDGLQWSPNAEYLLGLPGKNLPISGKSYSALVEPGLGMSRADAIAADAVVSHPRGMPYQISYGLRLDDETIAMVEDRGRWFADQDGRPVLAHGSITLTGKIDPHLLPVQTKARSEFLSAISRNAGTRNALRNAGILVFAIEFDGDGGRADFRPGIHDHPQGLEILDEVMERARTMMRRNDRLLLQPDGSIALGLMACSSADIPHAAARLRNCIEGRPIVMNGTDVGAVVRIGGACAPDHGNTSLQLLTHAEEALAETTPKDGRIRIFSGMDRTYIEMERSLTTFLAATDRLNEQALNRDLILARRPLFDIGTRLPALHLAGPGRRNAEYQVAMAEDLRLFAEAAGLTARLDRQLLHLACAELSADHDGILLLPVSGATLTDPEWPVLLAESIGARPSVASRLIVGISESFAATDPGLTEGRMHGMKALGIGVALLDVGNGFLPYNQIDQLPVDLVTIDGALIQNIAASTDNRFYLRSLIDLFQGRDIAVAATWIEDERTASLLDDWGVGYLEGRIRQAAPQYGAMRRTA